MADTVSELEDGFRRGLSELLHEWPRLDRVLDHVASEEAVEYGRAAARRSLAPLIWRTIAGELLTTEQARELLGVSRQALHKRVEKGTLLGLPGERTTLFPAWQFTESGQVRDAVLTVLRIFRDRLGPDLDTRMVLAWASASQPELKDESPAEWIRCDREAEPLLRSAERAADALAR